MQEHYTYDELYGTLLYHNKEDTERTYFVIECNYWSFYRWMNQYGWNLISKKSFNNGYKVTMRTNRLCV